MEKKSTPKQDGFEKTLEEIAQGHKRVILLDRNFHVYVHGPLNKLKISKDRNGRYVKLYFDEIK